MLWKIDLLSLVVDPDVLKRVLKHGAQAVLESEPDLTRWDTVSLATCVWYPRLTIDPHFRLSVMATVERHVRAVLKVLSPNARMIFPLTVLSPTAVLDAVDNGLGADGEVIEVLHILTKLIDG